MGDSMATIDCGATDIGTNFGRLTSGCKCSGKKEKGFGSTSSWTTSGLGGMVSLIGWIVTTCSYEDSVSTTVDEPGFVETNCGDFGICEYDASLEVLMVLVLVEWCRFRWPEVTFGVKGGLSAILCKRRGKGCSSSTTTDLFYEKKQIKK